MKGNSAPGGSSVIKAQELWESTSLFRHGRLEGMVIVGSSWGHEYMEGIL